MSLTDEELWKVCRMRARGKTWKEITEAIPNKNVYQRFQRLSNFMLHVSNEGVKCRKCGEPHKVKVNPNGGYE